MKKKSTLLTATAWAVVLVLLSVVIYFNFFFDLLGPCKENDVTETKSPNGDYIATEFRLDCGATSDWATDFDIKNIQTGVEQRLLSLKGDLVASCNIVWLNETTLKIKCDGPTGFVYNSKNEFEGIKIIFEPSGLGTATQ
jgi:hypothetical protein